MMVKTLQLFLLVILVLVYPNAEAAVIWYAGEWKNDATGLPKKLSKQCGIQFETTVYAGNDSVIFNIVARNKGKQKLKVAEDDAILELSGKAERFGRIYGERSREDREGALFHPGKFKVLNIIFHAPDSSSKKWMNLKIPFVDEKKKKCTASFRFEKSKIFKNARSEESPFLFAPTVAIGIYGATDRFKDNYGGSFAIQWNAGFYKFFNRSHGVFLRLGLDLLLGDTSNSEIFNSGTNPWLTSSGGVNVAAGYSVRTLIEKATMGLDVGPILHGHFVESRYTGLDPSYWLHYGLFMRTYIDVRVFRKDRGTYYRDEFVGVGFTSSWFPTAKAGPYDAKGHLFGMTVRYTFSLD